MTDTEATLVLQAMTDTSGREKVLEALLKRAKEELRLIHMKDCGAIYDVGLRAEMAAALASPSTQEPALRGGTLNDYARICHEANIQWWQRPEDGTPIERNKGELLMLIVSEVAECMEGERKGLPDDKLPHRSMAEVELADILIRVFDYAGAHGYDLHGAYIEKMAFNTARENHKHEARVRAGGKKW